LPAVPADPLESRYRARSMWMDHLPGPLTPRPPLAGDRDVDVAIVGAGFTGLWAAYYLKHHQPDLRVMVLEREIAGFGPSGRNGGWVSPGAAGTTAGYGDRDGVRRGRLETFRAVDEIGEVVARERIECGYLKAGGMLVATSEPQQRRLREGTRDGSGPDADVGWHRLDRDAAAQHARVKGCLEALYSPTCARIDPARLARGLADACEAAGVIIHERTTATALAPGWVTCHTGTVRAESVLRATESYTTEFPGQRRRYLPLYSLMIATEPLPADTWDELGWRDGFLVGDYRHLFFYAQRTADGRIAIGGRGAPYRLMRPLDEGNERSAAVRDRLLGVLRRHFPAAAGAAITHHWGGPLAVPRDWCMAVTYDPARGVGWAGGYSGHGVAASNISGRTLADLVLRRDTDLVSLPWVGHRSRQWEPEPLRFLASRSIVRLLESADAYEDRTGRSARRTRLVAPFMAGD
jgi:glycine/D-amino acid oxidase-like deaminating enzyme